MHDDLRGRLLQAGVISQQQHATLDARAGVSGGSTLREVLALGISQEVVTGYFERRGFGPPLTARQLAERDTTLAERLSPTSVRRLVALPLRRDTGTVLVAMADPSDRAAVAELAHRLDSPVRPQPARVDDLLRAIDEALPLPASTAGTIATTPSVVPPPPVPSHEMPVGPEPPGPTFDLVTRRTPDSDTHDDTDVAIPLVRPAADTQPQVSDAAQRPSLPQGVARTSQLPPAPSRPSSHPPLPPAAITAPRLPGLPARRSFVPARPSTQDLGSPVPIEGLLRDIARANDRDAVLRAACHAAATVCRSAVFVARRRDLLIGWEGTGLGIARDTIRNLWLPVSSPSVFQDALARARDYLGPPGTSSVDCLYRAVVGSRGGTMLVRPVMLRGKVIALLVVDGLGFGDQGAMRISTVVSAVIEAFERIILAQKAAGLASEPPQ